MNSSDKFTMNTLKKNMIKTALERYKHIVPCATLPSLDESFTVEDEKVFFWFNTDDHSTHVVTAPIYANYNRS